MSIIVEIDGFLAGALSEYARKMEQAKNLYGRAYFIFIVGASYVLLVPSDKDKWISIAAVGELWGLFVFF
jgi:hypothetical protein